MPSPFRHWIRLVVSIASGLLLALGILALTSGLSSAATINYPACGSMQACIDAAANGDVINIASGAYTDSFTLNKAVSLIGTGSSATTLTAVSGQRVITVTGASISNTVVISGVTIAGGNAGADGGGLLITDSAKPVLTNLVVSGNAGQSGGGLYAAANSGPQLNNVHFKNNSGTGSGGGAYLGAPGTLTEVTFESNAANSNGGGLYAAGAVTLTAPQFLSNTAGGDGGGLVAHGAAIVDGGLFQNNASNAGGALHTYAAAALTNTQIISNSAGVGGALAYFGDVTLAAARLISNTAHNGTAIYAWQGGRLWVTNSLFARNYPKSGSAATIELAEITATPTGTVELVHSTIGSPTLVNAPAILNGGLPRVLITNTIIVSHSTAIRNVTTVVTGSVYENYNLFFGNTITTTGIVTSGGNSISGDPIFINPLADDYRLSLGSAAIDAGTNAGVTSDFEGDARPVSGGYDIGFDEYAFPPGFIPGFRNVSTTGTDVGTCLAAFCRTIAYAMSQVQADTETVSIAAGTYAESVVVTKTVTIRGAGAAATFMDNGGAGRMFEIARGATVTLQALHIHSGTAEYGGGILNRGTLTLHSVVVNGNEATSAGGGVFNAGDLTVRQSAIINNRAAFGGGLYNLGTLTLENATLSGNQASLDGGGIYDYRSNLNMRYSTVADNRGNTGQSATGMAGGVYVVTNTTPITIETSIIAGNSLGDASLTATDDCNLALASAGYNLTAGGTGCGFTGGTGNITTTTIFTTVLAPLAPYVNNMYAHALLTNSVALDAIPAGANGCGSAPTVDQRGIARPTGANCDIGAFESVADTPLSGLSASSSSPAILGNAVMFTATVASGSNPAFAWDFGDGQVGVGATPAHVYSFPGLYTVTVKAYNGNNDVSASLTASVRLPNADLGFRPATHGYSFASQTSAFPQTATLIDLLGAEKACDLTKPVFTSTTPGSCTVAPVLLNAIGGKTIGQAYGMAVTSLRFFKNIETPGAIVPGATTVPALAHTATVADHLARYAYQQLSRPVSPTGSPWERSLSAAEALQRIHDGLTLKLAGDDAYIMALPVAGQGRSHTVVPFKLTYVDNENWAMGIYDPYFPLDDARQVLFDLATGAWVYTTTVPGSGTVLNLSSQGAASRIDLRRLSTHRPSGVTLAHTSGLPAEIIRTLQAIGLANGPMAFVTGNCFSAPGLNHAPDASGRCDAPLPNSGPIQCLLVDMTPAGQVCATLNVTATAGLTLHPSAGGAVGFDLLTDAGTSASLAATASTTDSVALSLSPDARQIAITSTGALSSTQVTLIVQSASGSSPGYVITLGGPALAAGSAFSATVDEISGRLAFGDTDSRTLSYNIRLDRLNPDGTTSTFQAYGVNLADGSATADIGNWDGSGAINFTFGDSGTPTPIPNQVHRLFMPYVKR